jgi:hypothetical protein
VSDSLKTQALRVVREYAGAAGVLAGLLGAVFYALLTLACAQVYEPLGVNPSDLGLSYGELLIRTVTFLIPISAAATGAALFGALAASVANEALEGSGKVLRIFVFLVPAVAVGGVVAWLSLSSGTYTESPFWAAAAPTALGFLIGWFLCLGALARPPNVEPTRAGRPDSGHRTDGDPVANGVVLWIAVTVTLLLIAVSYVFISAKSVDSRRLKSGSTPRRLLGNTIPPPWDAQVVHLSWVAGTKPADLDLPPCLLYLGQANGTSVFYDARKKQRRALRLPSSAVALVARPDADSAVGADCTAANKG